MLYFCKNQNNDINNKNNTNDKISKLHVGCKIFSSCVLGQGSKNERGNSQNTLTNLLRPTAHFFGLMWSTHKMCWSQPGCFQNLPALSKVAHEFLFSQNF
jgi:hypothetical protein